MLLHFLLSFSLILCSNLTYGAFYLPIFFYIICYGDEISTAVSWFFERMYITTDTCKGNLRRNEILLHSTEFFTHLETSTLPEKRCKFWPLHVTYGHWAVRFFSMPHLLWHGASVYNGHVRGPVTLAFVAESVAAAIRTPKPPLAGQTLKPTAQPPRPCWSQSIDISTS